jgi:hypothetical protein
LAIITLTQAVHNGASSEVLKTMTTTLGETLAAMTQRRASGMSPFAPTTAFGLSQPIPQGPAGFDALYQLAKTFLGNTPSTINPGERDSNSEDD